MVDLGDLVTMVSVVGVVGVVDVAARLLMGKPGKKALRIPKLGMHTLLNGMVDLGEVWGGNQRVGQRQANPPKGAAAEQQPTSLACNHGGRPDRSRLIETPKKRV